MAGVRHLALRGNRGSSDFVVQTCCLQFESFQVRHRPFEIDLPNSVVSRHPTVLHSVVIVQAGGHQSCRFCRETSAPLSFDYITGLWLNLFDVCSQRANNGNQYYRH